MRKNHFSYIFIWLQTAHCTSIADIIDYVIIRKRLNVIKTQDIIDRMQDVFDYIREKLKKSQLIIIE